MQKIKKAIINRLAEAQKGEEGHAAAWGGGGLLTILLVVVLLIIIF
jgi:hypothetical protein